MPKIVVHNTETGDVQEVRLGYGANLRQAILYTEAEIYKGINKFLNCRGMGLCAKCLVEIDNPENVNADTFFESTQRKLHKFPENQRMSCRVKVYGDIHVKTALAD